MEEQEVGGIAMEETSHLEPQRMRAMIAHVPKWHGT